VLITAYLLTYVHILLHAEFSAVDHALNIVSKCRFSLLYLNIDSLQIGPGKLFMGSWKSPGFFVTKGVGTLVCCKLSNICSHYSSLNQILCGISWHVILSDLLEGQTCSSVALILLTTTTDTNIDCLFTLLLFHHLNMCSFLQSYLYVIQMCNFFIFAFCL